MLQEQQRIARAHARGRNSTAKLIGATYQITRKSSFRLIGDIDPLSFPPFRLIPMMASRWEAPLVEAPRILRGDVGDKARGSRDSREVANSGLAVIVRNSLLFQPQIRQIASGMCIDSAGKSEDLHQPVGLYPCHRQGGNQVRRRRDDGVRRANHSSGLF
jgi:hypothetical protein